MGNIIAKNIIRYNSFRKRSLEVVPPEIIRIIFEYLPISNTMSISKKFYEIALQRIQVGSARKILHDMFITVLKLYGKVNHEIFVNATRSDWKWNHEYFHEDLFRVVCNNLGTIEIIERLAIKVRSDETSKIKLLQRYVIFALEHNLSQKKTDIPGTLFYVKYLDYAHEIIAPYVTICIYRMTTYAIKILDLVLFKRCVAEPYYGSMYNAKQVVVDIYKCIDPVDRDKFLNVILQKFYGRDLRDIQRFNKYCLDLMINAHQDQPEN